MIPEYEAKNRTRVFSEPRHFQKPHLDEEQDDIQENNKTFSNAAPTFQLHNSAVVKPNNSFPKDLTDAQNNEQMAVQKANYTFLQSNQAPTHDFTHPLMNTWTNNKFANTQDDSITTNNKKKLSTRPRSGNPSPTKMDTGVAGLAPTKLMMSYNSRQNPIMQKPYPINTDAVILGSYTNQNQNITPVSIQPHQRYIKKGMMGNKFSNVTNDMYRIYGKSMRF